VLAPDGTEQRRIEGYLPAAEMLAQLTLALGYVAVARKDWSAAESYFASVPERYPGTEAAPEGLYWAGVARYSGSHDGAALKELNRVFTTRYSDTAWAKRTAVWSS
jgi:outer membrane protein assembly factor BamD (BamD/ComL family)